MKIIDARDENSRQYRILNEKYRLNLKLQCVHGKNRMGDVRESGEVSAVAPGRSSHTRSVISLFLL